MLKKAVDDADDANAFTQARHAGTQATDAAHIEFDLDSCLRCLVESLDQRRILHIIDSQLNAGGKPLGCARGFGIDQIRQLIPQRERRGGQPGQPQMPGPGRDRIKKCGHIGTQILTGSEVADVRIQPGRGFVVVAAPEMRITLDPSVFLPDDQTHFGVRLEPPYSIDNLRASGPQFFGALKIPFFVKTRLELDQYRDRFPFFRSMNQGCDNFTARSRPVQELLDGQYIDVVSGLLHKAHNRIK